MAGRRAVARLLGRLAGQLSGCPVSAQKPGYLAARFRHRSPVTWRPGFGTEAFFSCFLVPAEQL